MPVRGDDDTIAGTLPTVHGASDLGDEIVVLDRCPLFERVSASGRFRAIRGRIATRTAEVLAAYRSTAG